MDEDFQRSYLECIEYLRRNAATDEDFAEQLADVATAMGAFTDNQEKSDAILNMARLHRVAAIKMRARMAGLMADYEARYGDGAIPSGSGLDPLLP